MYVFPLVERELRVAVRRPSTRRLRIFFGAGTFAAVVWAFLVWGTSFTSAGWVFFNSACVIASVLSLLTGIVIASDSISRERREGTLGLLYLTDLDALDVVMGKLAAAGVVPLFTLLAMFPSLAICQLLGGVAPDEFWRGILILGTTLFFSLAGTVFVSSFCEHRRSASLGAALLLVTVNPLFLWYLTWQYRGAATLFWSTLIGLLLLGACLLGAAACFVSRAWRDREVREEQARIWVHRGRTARPLLEKLPVAWMMLRRRSFPPAARWSALAGMFCFFGMLLWMSFTPARVSAELLLILILHLVFLATVLGRTAYSFYTDRQDGSLELLLGTRLTNEDIFTGFVRFLLDQSFILFAFLTALDLLFSTALALSGYGDLATMPLAAAVTLWLSFLAARWVGVYRSLMVNLPALAMLTTFGRLAFVPLALSALFLWAPRTNFVKVMEFWVVSSAMLALFFGHDARTTLVKVGRDLLLRPFTEKPPHLESEWSFINWDEVLNEEN